MKDHLIFDTTDAVSIVDSDSVGAFVRGGQSGALITNHALQKPSAGTFNFVDGDVTTATDIINSAAHGLQTGDKVQLTTSGTLPVGLSLATDYYVIRVDANNIKLASSQPNAELGVAVDITAAAGGGTHTVTGAEAEVRALDVWLTNPSVAITDGGGSITVDGTVAATQSGAWTVAATQSGTWTIDSITNDVNISDGGNSITVDATSLDIRPLTNADVVTVEQGTSPWVVSATQLDIDDLDYTSDNVAIKGATGNQLVVNADGSINVQADISVVTGSDKAEDSAHVSGDIGTYVLAVRQDTLAASTSADGDYGSLKTSATGALYVNLAESSGAITINDAALAVTGIANAANPLNTANTAEAAVSSALANRKYLWIYNNDNTKVFIGSASVTAANGFPVSPGSYMELRAGAAVSPFFVGQNGKTPEIRTLELS